MAERHYYIGGAGPFLYDDEDIIDSDEWDFADGETRKGFRTDGPMSTTYTALEDDELVRKADIGGAINFAEFIDGTANQVIVTDDGDGSVTISTPQSINNSANVVFGTITTTGAISTSHTAVGDNELVRKADIGGIIDFAASIIGTANQVIVTDNGDGTITLSTSQDINAGANVEFGVVQSEYKSSDGSAGWTGAFGNADGNTVTVKDGIITDVS